MNLQPLLNAAWCLTCWLTAVALALTLLGRGRAVIRRSLCRLGLAGIPIVLAGAVAYSLADRSAGLYSLPQATRAPVASVDDGGPADTATAGTVTADVDVVPLVRDAGPEDPETSDMFDFRPEIALADQPAPSVVSPAVETPDRTPAVGASASLPPPGPPVVGPVVEPIVTPPANRASWRWALWLLPIGSLALAGRLAIGLLRLAIWRRRWHPAAPAWTALAGRLAKRIGLKRPFTVLTADDLAAPAATGVFRPAVALPTRAPARKAGPALRGVLAHELGHLAGRDPTWKVIADAARVLAWWCPLTWWLCRRERIESELTADDHALTGGARPMNLAETLMTFARAGRARRAGGLVSGMACHLRRRIKMMLNDKLPHTPRISRRVKWILPAAACLAAAAIVTTPLVGVAGAEEGHHHPEPGHPGRGLEPPRRPVPDVRPEQIAESIERLRHLLEAQEQLLAATEQLHELRERRAHGEADEDELRGAQGRFEQARRSAELARWRAYERAALPPPPPGPRLPAGEPGVTVNVGVGRGRGGPSGLMLPPGMTSSARGGRGTSGRPPGGMLPPAVAGLGMLMEGRRFGPPGVESDIQSARGKLAEREGELERVRERFSEGRDVRPELAHLADMERALEKRIMDLKLEQTQAIAALESIEEQHERGLLNTNPLILQALESDPTLRRLEDGLSDCRRRERTLDGDNGADDQQRKRLMDLVQGVEKEIEARRNKLIETNLEALRVNFRLQERTITKQLVRTTERRSELQARREKIQATGGQVAAGEAGAAEIAVAEALVREARDELERAERRREPWQKARELENHIRELDKELDRTRAALDRLRHELETGQAGEKVVRLVEEHFERLRRERQGAYEELERARQAAGIPKPRRRGLGRPAIPGVMPPGIMPGMLPGMPGGMAPPGVMPTPAGRPAKEKAAR